MFSVGRVCIKLAGRDAGQKCVVVEVLEGNYVLVDGMTRRRKCNTMHLEPLDQKLELSTGASHDHVIKAFKELGHEVKTTTKKSIAGKPKKSKAVKAKKPVTEAKAKKVAEKKEKSTVKKAKKE